MIIMLNPSAKTKMQSASMAALAVNTCQISNRQKSAVLLDLIKQNHAELNPRKVNNELIPFFGGTSLSRVGFCTGLHRLEDHFIIDGLEPAVRKILRGQPVKILEQAAGSSLPAMNNIGGHTGHPWLARTIARSLEGYKDLVTITVADKNADYSQFVVVDGKGQLVFFSFDKKKLNILPEDHTSFNKPGSFDQLLKYLTPEQGESLAHIIRITGTKFILRPLLDPVFEARYNLKTLKQSYFDFPKADSEKYDYIFSRHSIQRDNPRYLSEQSFKILIESTRRQLTADGEARLVFDHPFLPKACLIIRHDSYTTRHIMPLLGTTF